MVNNLEQIKSLLKFEDKDDFFFAQIICRAKENPDLGSNNYVVKTYYIKSITQLDRDFPEMVCLANFHNARVYINLNKRNFKQCSIKTIRCILDQIENKDEMSIPSAFNTVCGRVSDKNDKKWILDYDELDLNKLEEVKSFINTLQPENNGDKIKDLIRIDNSNNDIVIDEELVNLYGIVPTKNGYHLITSPFNTNDFHKRYPEISIHRNNPTVLYIP
jgi:hypothetical protein